MAQMVLEDSSSSSWTVAPRWATPRTPERPSYGPIVAAVSEAIGRPLMPHQRLVVDVGLEVQSEAAGDPSPGEWAYNDILDTGPRRKGKTAIVTPVAAHRARMLTRARIFQTAQNRDKARARWMDATEDILSTPLRSEVRRKISQGFEELRWISNGSLFLPFAPNEDGLHSETPDLVIVDELWAFTKEQRRAIQAGYVPAFATTSGQAWKFSTAGTEKSAWLNDDRKAGRAAVEAGVRLGRAHFEWSLPERLNGRPLLLLSDEEIVQACIDYHPAVCHVPGCPGPAQRRPCPHGFTVRPAAIRSAWDTMADRAEFIRAYGNVTQSELTQRWETLAEETWTARIDMTGIPAAAPAAFGVWVDEDGQDAAVASGWRDQAGVMHVEHLALLDSPRKVLPYLLERVTKPVAVAVPNTGHARDVADELAGEMLDGEPRFPVVRVSQADVTAACSRHKTALDEGPWLHRNHPEPTAAAAGVGWRLGRWERLDGSISALGAQTMAGWAYDHAPEPEKPLPPFWMG